ncbi:MAG: hypothetical protein M3Y48_24065 [Actinomycetota bacterium]|nr:hypothetical protein [Actinomycetota bacterium]
MNDLAHSNSAHSNSAHSNSAHSNSAHSNTVNTTELIRIGIFTMPLAAALKILGNLGTFNSIGYGIPQGSEAATVSGAGFFVGELVGSIFPVLLTPF